MFKNKRSEPESSSTSDRTKGQELVGSATVVNMKST